MQLEIRAIVVLLVGVLTLSGCGAGGGDEGNPTGGGGNTGLAVAANFPTGVISLDEFLIFLVNEFEQAGTDLNGDGDTADDVVHVLNTTTGVSTNLGLSGLTAFAATADRLAWALSEAEEGATDFSGDGAPNDNVLVLFDPTAPVSPTNPMVTTTLLGDTPFIVGHGSLITYSITEVDAGVDLNGDMDLLDFILQSYMTTTDTVFNHGLPLSPTDPSFTVFDDFIAFGADEATHDPTGMGMGTDFNLDGDMADHVLLIARPLMADVLPVGPGGIASAISPGGFTIIGTPADLVVAYGISEADEGAINLNGGGLFNDSDTDDFILAVWHMNTLVETIPGGGIGVQPGRISGSTTRIIAAVTELENGLNGTDLNVDSDTADVVAFWVDLAVPSVLNNTGLAITAGGEDPVTCGEFAVVLAEESDQGSFGTNYNEFYDDDDVDDTVAFFIDMRAPGFAPINLQVAATGVLCSGQNGEFVILVADESANGGMDLNHDGDNQDLPPCYFPVAAGVINTTPSFFSLDGNATVLECTNSVRLISFAKEGTEATIQDENQDGDMDDWVVMTVLIRKATGGFLGESFEGTVQTDAAIDSFPMIVNGNTFVFPSPEENVLFGVNLNSDGDQADTVLFYRTFMTWCP